MDAVNQKDLERFNACPPVDGKVKVRIAVSVNPDGDFCAFGCSLNVDAAMKKNLARMFNMDAEEAANIKIITVELEVGT